MAEKKLKFLVCNNYNRFASKDVWDGLFATLRQDFKYDVLPYPVDQMPAFFSYDMIANHILATAVKSINGFTHMICVSSTFMKQWMFDTCRKCGVKTIYWSLEDPHAFDQNSPFMEWADYYFTNEVAVSRAFEKAVYLPTAGAETVCVPPSCRLAELPDKERKILDNDVVFCGNVYPNRRKVLEPLLPLFEKHGIRFGLMGVTGLMEDDGRSPLVSYIKGDLHGVVDHRWFVMAYGFAKFVINIERDPEWTYNEEYSTNKIHKIAGESLNPRAYEIALCGGGLQLIDEKRKELFSGKAFEVGKHLVTYKNSQDLVDKILYYRAHENERRRIVEAAREHALKNHTYRSRAKRMVDTINWKEGRREGVIQEAVSRVFGGGLAETKKPAH